jgi:hypothetical protein
MPPTNNVAITDHPNKLRMATLLKRTSKTHHLDHEKKFQRATGATKKMKPALLQIWFIGPLALHLESSC